MATLNFPSDIIPAQCNFRLQYNTQTFKSPLSGVSQTLELAGAKWLATLRFVNLSTQQARILGAWYSQLRGEAGRFYLHDFSLENPQGIATGSPVVSGADQTGIYLNTSGWTASQTGIMKAGDMIQIGTELKTLTADSNSDGSGNATLMFEPPIRVSPTDTSAVVISKPKAIFKLTGDNQGGFPAKAFDQYDYTLEAEEAL